jgi:hypothetical protein
MKTLKFKILNDRRIGIFDDDRLLGHAEEESLRTCARALGEELDKIRKSPEEFEGSQHRRLTAEELGQIANAHAGFLDSLPAELSALVVERMRESGCDEVQALRDVTRSPKGAALWHEHQAK